MGLFDSLFGWIKRGDSKSPRDAVASASVDTVAKNNRIIKPELVIVGLGNPGEKYENTRHNIGFMVIEKLRESLSDKIETNGWFCESSNFIATCGDGENQKTVLFARPQTYMSLSGDAVGGLLKKYKLTAGDCLIVVDDFNIPLGKIRFRKNGSHGGHNGLKSISSVLGSDDYPRLRVGIGPRPQEISIIDFVLGNFCDEEVGDVESVVKKCVDAVLFMIDNGIDKSMTSYN